MSQCGLLEPKFMMGYWTLSILHVKQLDDEAYLQQCRSLHCSKNIEESSGVNRFEGRGQVPHYFINVSLYGWMSGMSA